MKKLFNRMVSCILVGCMTTSSLAFAADTKEDIQVVPSDNSAYHCEITWNNDTDFTVTGYLNGEVTETVTGSIGGETVTMTTYSDSDRSLSETEYNVSDIISKAEYNESVPNDEVETISAAPRAASYKYAGSVTYRQPTSSGKYKNVYVYAFYTNTGSSTVDHYALNAEAGTALSVLISIVLSATGVYFSGTMMGFIVSALGSSVDSGKLAQRLYGYFRGTKYDMKVRFQNKYSNPSATETRTGSAFNGYFSRDDIKWSNGKAYEGFYAQFIREKDRSVANSAYNFFYDGPMTITNWNNQF